MGFVGAVVIAFLIELQPEGEGSDSEWFIALTITFFP
jgi:hypothetical protein